jgi:hypothetical protein
MKNSGHGSSVIFDQTNRCVIGGAVIDNDDFEVRNRACSIACGRRNSRMDRGGMSGDSNFCRLPVEDVDRRA